jgi:hypothetical protein
MNLAFEEEVALLEFRLGQDTGILRLNLVISRQPVFGRGHVLSRNMLWHLIISHYLPNTLNDLSMIGKAKLCIIKT